MKKDFYELHRLLGILLSKELTQNEKLAIIEEEYAIPVEENFREDVNFMCNLSQGIKEDGIAIGIAENTKQIILNMYHNNFSMEQIAIATSKNIEDIKAIIEESESVFV